MNAGWGEAAQGGLLELLPRKDCLALLAMCTGVDLAAGQVIREPGERIRYAYFPNDSIVCLLMRVETGAELAVALVGREGMVGLPLVLGVDVSPLRVIVQDAGHAWRLGAVALAREMAGRPAVRRLFSRYLQASMTQMEQGVACTRFHLVEQRLARWMLMTGDRSSSGDFHMTHEFLARLLGVRRVGITNAANELQDLRLIRYHRGKVAILDRAGLETASCGCYLADRQSYRGLMPALR